MFGYACNETEAYVCPNLFLFSCYLSDYLKPGILVRKRLGPDSKSQITLAYENGKPVRAHSIVVSTQHTADLGQECRCEGNCKAIRS